MGLLSSPPGGSGGTRLKGIRLSPTKTEGGVRQVVIRGAHQQPQQQQVQQVQSSGPQVIRIPTSSLQAGSIQQIKVGNKIQYVRVVGAAQNVRIYIWSVFRM